MKTIKELSPIDWVRLAVSKDASRYNLVSVYGTGSEVVATDGNRLHLAKVKGISGYLDDPSIDGEFVDFKVAIPTGAPSETIELMPNSRLELLTKLDAFIKCGKALGLANNQLGVMLDLDGEKMIFRREFANELYHTSFEVRISRDILRPFDEMVINAPYLFDALTGAKDSVRIEFRGPISAIVVECDPMGEVFRQAVVMPLRAV